MLVLRDTALSSGGPTYRVAISTPTISTSDLSVASMMSPTVPPPSPSIGTKRTIMTTATSWKIRNATATCPVGELVSPRSERSFNTTAVELSATRQPR